MRRILWIVIAAAAVIAAVSIHRYKLPSPVPTPRGAFSFGVFGDAPYYGDEELRYPFLLRHMNSHDVAFVVHVGDIFWHPCTDEHYAEALRNFNSLRMPVVYSPGDNEWTDCWEQGSGSFAPLERLARIRQMFFAHPQQSLGAHPMPVVSEGGEFIENARWSRDGVVFATVNLPGSRNAMRRFPARTAADDDEVRRRTEAAAAWTRAAFAEARATNARAVVISCQANMNVERPDDYTKAYEPFVSTLTAESARWQRPVLLAHGDGHVYVVDHPFHGVPNLTRMQVPGSPLVGWVRVVVTPDTRFEFKEFLVPRWKMW